ncbi:MAG: hypothetical protein ACI8S6_002744, partial [Myxococcota bacterium]
MAILSSSASLFDSNGQHIISRVTRRAITEVVTFLGVMLPEYDVEVSQQAKQGTSASLKDRHARRADWNFRAALCSQSQREVQHS